MTRLQKHYLWLLWKQKWFSMLGTIMAIVTAYAGIALVATAGWFISAAALAGLTAASAMAFNYLTPGAIVRGFSMARTAGRYAERLTSHEATFRIISRIRSDVFRFLAARSWYEQPFNRHQTGSRMLQDIQHVESIYLSAILPGLVVASVAVGYLCMLGYFLPGSMWFAAPLTGSVVLVMPVIYSRLVLASQNGLHTARAVQWQEASSILSNLRTLTLHGQTERASERMMSRAADADLLEARSIDRQQWVILLSQWQLVALTVLVFYLALESVFSGALEAANAFMLLLLTLGSAEVFITATSVFAAFQLGVKSLSRLDEAAGEADMDDARNLVALDAPGVVLAGVSYHYPEKSAKIFAGVNYQFEGPGWFWVTGASGSGKSTLIALLAGRIQPQEGVITISTPDHHYPSLMPQNIGILRASLRDNLCLHNQYTDDQINQALSDVELDEWAARLPQGLDTWLGEGEWQPSGGEIKRIGLARVLLQDRGVILLDEPSAGMDAALAQRIFKRLASIWKDKLVIANTHQAYIKQDTQTNIALSDIDGTHDTTESIAVL